MAFGIAPWEIVALALVALLLFGSTQLPRIGRQLGKGAREARQEYLEVKRSFEFEEEPKEPKPEPETETAASRRPSAEA